MCCWHVQRCISGCVHAVLCRDDRCVDGSVIVRDVSSWAIHGGWWPVVVYDVRCGSGEQWRCSAVCVLCSGYLFQHPCSSRVHDVPVRTVQYRERVNELRHVCTRAVFAWQCCTVCAVCCWHVRQWQWQWRVYKLSRGSVFSCRERLELHRVRRWSVLTWRLHAVQCVCRWQLQSGWHCQLHCVSHRPVRQRHGAVDRRMQWTMCRGVLWRDVWANKRQLQWQLCCRVRLPCRVDVTNDNAVPGRTVQHRWCWRVYTLSDWSVRQYGRAGISGV